jgi:hypothetical protein
MDIFLDLLNKNDLYLRSGCVGKGIALNKSESKTYIFDLLKLKNWCLFLFYGWELKCFPQFLKYLFNSLTFYFNFKPESLYLLHFH